MSAAFTVFNFLAYSTTASVARQIGARNRRRAAELGVDGLWLAVGLGLVLTALGLALAPVIADAMGASAAVRPFAVTYLRISILGAPFLLLTLAGAGYLRGVQDTRTTLVIAVAANGINLVLELLFVYTFDLGIAGSAWGTVIAQILAAVAYLAVVGGAARRDDASVRPRWQGIRSNAVIGSRLIVRTGALLVTLLTATAIAARFGDDDVAAQQIAMQVLLLLALALDALAIAAQAMIGRSLGADEGDEARVVAGRILAWGVVCGIVLAVVVVADALLAGDPLHRRRAGTGTGRAVAVVRGSAPTGSRRRLRARRRAHRCRRRGVPGDRHARRDRGGVSPGGARGVRARRRDLLAVGCVLPLDGGTARRHDRSVRHDPLAGHGRRAADLSCRFAATRRAVRATYRTAHGR